MFPLATPLVVVVVISPPLISETSLPNENAPVPPNVPFVTTRRPRGMLMQASSVSGPLVEVIEARLNKPLPVVDVTQSASALVTVGAAVKVTVIV